MSTCDKRHRHAGDSVTVGVEDPDLKTGGGIGGHGHTGKRGKIEGHLDGSIGRDFFKETFHVVGRNIDHWGVPVDTTQCDKGKNGGGQTLHNSVIDHYVLGIFGLSIKNNIKGIFGWLFSLFSLFSFLFRFRFYFLFFFKV